MKQGNSATNMRPQTSEGDIRPASRGGVKSSASTRKLYEATCYPLLIAWARRPLEPTTGEAKKKKQAEGHRAKWKQKQERLEAKEKQQQHELELLEKFNAEKRALVQERQAALAKLTTTKKKRKPKKRHVVVPPPVSFHKLASKESKRFQAKIHSTHAHRADSLEQLRHWAKPTPEIYVLASLLYKLVALETPSAIQIVDVWRWLPWSILQTVFRNDLVQTLQAVPVADLSPRYSHVPGTRHEMILDHRSSLAVLYLHCAQPRFTAKSIDERSAVGTALRMWVNNVAAVHDLVDPATLHVKGIDSLKSCGVSCRDIGALLKDCSAYTDKMAMVRHEDLALLRELYATQPPPGPSHTDTMTKLCADHTPASALINLLDLPDFNRKAPKSRSKLAARLAARLHERHDMDESIPLPKDKGGPLYEDFVVVYKLTMPAKQEKDALNPINYIQQKRRDSTIKQASPWMVKPSRSTSHLPKKVVSTCPLIRPTGSVKASAVDPSPFAPKVSKANCHPITTLEQHAESDAATDDRDVTSPGVSSQETYEQLHPATHNQSSSLNLNESVHGDSALAPLDQVATAKEDTHDLPTTTTSIHDTATSMSLEDDIERLLTPVDPANWSDDGEAAYDRLDVSAMPDPHLDEDDTCDDNIIDDDDATRSSSSVDGDGDRYNHDEFEAPTTSNVD
ncbi:hypothetical protein DYB38_002389 [Aphanomyces astaci]|uniref:Uncharacterized protein n=1 Tax=Aphanomyces astaci TaxID=112090 RepID=A0A397EB94_APHAT|nr:hypothetical protein DYB38_002389 [Aphanomyces astaci]